MNKNFKYTFLFALLLFSFVISNAQDNKTIKVGTKEWTAVNLDVFTFRNGDSIPQAKTDAEWEKTGKEGKPAWCYYDNKLENGAQYGKLYNWYAINDPRGIAPIGWHIPSYDEWLSFDNTLGGHTVTGTKNKSTSGWLFDGNGTNTSGFNGLPAGFRASTGLFKSVGEFGFWWSADKDDDNKDNAWLYFLHAKDKGSNASSRPKAAGLSVRCVKD